MVPRIWFPPTDPFTDHVTDELNDPVPCTLAANCCTWPGNTLMPWGLTITDVMLNGGGGGGGVGPPPPPHPQAATLAHARSNSVHMLEPGSRLNPWADFKESLLASSVRRRLLVNLQVCQAH